MAHRDEVVTDDAKTYPDFHTIMSFVAAAVQSMPPLEHDNPGFASGSPLLPLLKPARLLQLPAFHTLGGAVVLLNRDRLTALLRDPGSSDVIDHVGLRLVAGRADASQPDAYLQLSSDLDLPGLNRILDSLLQKFAVEAPLQMMRYHDFKLVLETDGDRVIGGSPLLSVSGFRFQPPVLTTDVAADLRLHLGRPGRDKITVRGLLNYVRSLQ
jgi:hypothetical protein